MGENCQLVILLLSLLILLLSAPICIETINIHIRNIQYIKMKLTQLNIGNYSKHGIKFMNNCVKKQVFANPSHFCQGVGDKNWNYSVKTRT